MVAPTPRTVAAVGASVILVVAGVAACTGDSETSRPTTSHEAQSSPPATTATATPVIDRAVAALRDTMGSNIHDVGIVAVVRIGKETRSIAAGLADVATKRPVRPDDRFAIASITKSMVATAVLHFVAEGRIRLDDSVDKWMPGLLPARDITVRHLLGHRSGLHEPAERELASSFTRREFVETSTRHKLDFRPGSDGAYSNVGYTVVGLLLERLSGQPLRTVLRQVVFDPAGMASTTFGGKPTVMAYDDGRVTRAGLTRYDHGASGVVSTAADVDRFYRHLFAGDLVPQRLVRLMIKPTGTVPFGLGEYGLGLWHLPIYCEWGVGHSGSVYGFSSKAVTLPEMDRSVVVLANHTDKHGLTFDLAENMVCA